MAGVLGRSWKSKRPLVFVHVVLTFGICRARDIRALITRWVDLWERGLHAGMLGDAETEGAVREGRAASGEEGGGESVSQSYHDTVLLGKLLQAFRRATDKEGGGYLLPDDQCTKTGTPVAVLCKKHPNMRVPPV